MPVLVCFSACPDLATASRIAEALVEARLAACVNVLPAVRSTYRWEGRVTSDDEVLVIAKTTTERIDALTLRLRELHPYTLPEIVALPVAGGLPAYLDWVVAETGPAPD
ncbi:divalent-cation tolerance protein CutA [Luteimonas sp. BDR2-5]|uniref:divalent-cation tolerance protein CutA n=1 Tax=Proluteimonas luteida TaxID=2878685 RepID=UPI001E453B29|nr:divalent-cation tolerance protein CutA [Luteimonas sp. BDR2-5]MCD9027125.1 divalent-cation tolerance protein CutA [Luteimonas sp. BDR2-5]